MGERTREMTEHNVAAMTESTRVVLVFDLREAVDLSLNQRTPAKPENQAEVRVRLEICWNKYHITALTALDGILASHTHYCTGNSRVI